MLCRVIAVVLSALAPATGLATRPSYWDLMWLADVSTICRAQSDRYNDVPLARSISLTALTGGGQEVTTCLRRGSPIQTYVCTEVMQFDVARIETDGRALREKYELETIEVGELISYLDKLRSSPSGVPSCPTMSAAPSRSAEIGQLVDAIAVCRTGVKPDSAPSVSERSDYYPTAALVARAEAGDAMAQNSLGVHYGLGTAGKKEPVLSATWYRRAADQGLALAQANLAYMYLKGEGVELDLKEAQRWAKMAADQGHFRGQLLLAHMYSEGIGVEPDGRQAARCYGAAAAQGSLFAQEALVRMYARGLGVPADRSQAKLWLQRVQEGRRTGKHWREQ